VLNRTPKIWATSASFEKQPKVNNHPSLVTLLPIRHGIHPAANTLTNDFTFS
jgi:hypothetical protein